MTSRPFRLTDAMILVAAVAAGLWVNRSDGHMLLGWRWNSYDETTGDLQRAVPHLVALTIAFVGMRMRRPRPAIRRIAREPGAAACITASAALLVVATWVGMAAAAGRHVQFMQMVTYLANGIGHGMGGEISHLPDGRLFTIYGDCVGFAVLGAWLFLLFSGCWRPEPTWIDRLGRALGALWIVLTLVLWSRCLML
jgi:hypothetical protein